MEEHAPVIPESVKGNEQVSVSAEFYRKLTQQIVQKDNIIKLLRLQVENLKAGGAADSSAVDDMRQQIAELEAQLEAEKRRIRRHVREDGFAEDERAELLEEAAGLRSNLAANEEKVNELIEERDELARRVVGLSDELVEIRQELEEARDDDGEDEEYLQTIEAIKNELAEALRERDELRKENTRLHERLDEAKQECSAAVAAYDEMRDEHQEANRKLASLPDVEKLELERDEAKREKEQAISQKAAADEKLAHKEAQLTKARNDARERMNRADLRLLTGIIEMHENLLSYAPDSLDSDLSEQISSVFLSLNLRRISTVGNQFDEELHNVLDTVYSTDYHDSTVISERSCGYEAAGVVVKKADVVVSRDPFWCEKCMRSAGEGSRFCNVCGGKLLAATMEEIKTERAKAEDLVRLGSAKEAEGEIENALKAYGQALELEPENRVALRATARLREHRGDWALALECYESLAKQGALRPSDERGKRRIKRKLEIVEGLKDIF